MKPTVTWILIADGAQAKVFRHAGPGKGLEAIRELQFEEEPMRARDIMSDRQGRSFSSAGAGRSAMEHPSDPVQVREARFVKSVAEVLDVKRREGAFDRLVIAAAPAALGDIRSALTDRLRQALLIELPKDLTNVPTSQLGKHFADILAV
jgi:protein required for attachment to host cells